MRTRYSLTACNEDDFVTQALLIYIFQLHMTLCFKLIAINYSISILKDLEFFTYDEVEYGIADDLNWFEDQVNKSTLN